MNPDLERLVGRAVTDKAFRDDLLADPAAAILASGLTLSPDETAKVIAAVAKGKRDKKGDAIEAAAAGYWV
jgi:hypothetical protein